MSPSKNTNIEGTGDGRDCDHVAMAKKKNSENMWKIIDNPLAKWVLTSILGLFLTAGTYYIKTEFVTRKEVNENFIAKKDFDNSVKREIEARIAAIEESQKDFVNKEVYNTKMESIKDSLTRIERALEENNRVLREVIEKSSRGGSN